MQIETRHKPRAGNREAVRIYHRLTPRYSTSRLRCIGLINYKTTEQEHNYRQYETFGEVGLYANLLVYDVILVAVDSRIRFKLAESCNAIRWQLTHISTHV